MTTSFDRSTQVIVGQAANEAPSIGPRQFFGWFLQPHPLLGWTMVPGKQGWYTRPEIKSFVRINSHGFRGREFSFQKPANTRRTLLLADSFGVGAEVAEDQVFGRLLEARLNETESASIRHEVINASVGGYGTEQHGLFLHLRGREFQPDWVILGFHFGDDVIENAKHLRTWWRVKVPRPHLEFRGDGTPYLIDLPPNRRAVRRVWMNFFDLLPWELRRTTQLPLPTPAGARATWALRRLATMATNNWSKLRRVRQLSMYPLMFVRPVPAPLEAAWQQTVHYLDFLRRSSLACGARLLVVGVCTKEQIVTGHLEQRLSQNAGTQLSIDTNYPNRRLGSILAQLQIPYLDLTPVFKAAEQAGQHLFFDSDLHWNAQGHALAAEQIKNTLSELEHA